MPEDAQINPLMADLQADMGGMAFTEMARMLAASPQIAELIAGAPPELRAMFGGGVPPEVMFGMMGFGAMGGMGDPVLEQMLASVSPSLAPPGGGTGRGRGDGRSGGNGAGLGSAGRIPEID
jgi:hypothetical protein